MFEVKQLTLNIFEKVLSLVSKLVHRNKAKPVHILPALHSALTGYHSVPQGITGCLSLREASSESLEKHWVVEQLGEMKCWQFFLDAKRPNGVPKWPGGEFWHS